MQAGTILTYLGLSISLEHTELLTDEKTNGEDEYLFHWSTPEGRSFLTTDIELDSLLVDGATLS